jgi:hypothetical protein
MSTESPFDGYLQCREHGVSRESYCLSCRYADEHNGQLHEALAVGAYTPNPEQAKIGLTSDHEPHQPPVFAPLERVSPEEAQRRYPPHEPSFESELRRQSLRAEGAAAERERIRLELLTWANEIEEGQRGPGTAPYATQRAFRDFARLLETP